MKIVKLICLCALSLSLFTGCAHQLEVKNLNDYQVQSMPQNAKGVSIGVISTNDRAELLTAGVANALSKYSYKVVHPLTMSKASEVDVVAKLTIDERHKGSGVNFFINFPGFLVWAPAWNGYVYKPAYDVTVDLIKSESGDHIETFTIPLDFDVRQSEFDRTWTEISWLESGIIAFIGGFVAMTYDSDITPTLERRIKSVVGDYIAVEMVKHLNSSSGS
jgi:hypothetical protein